MIITSTGDLPELDVEEQRGWERKEWRATEGTVLPFLRFSAFFFLLLLSGSEQRFSPTRTNVSLVFCENGGIFCFLFFCCLIVTTCGSATTWRYHQQL